MGQYEVDVATKLISVRAIFSSSCMYYLRWLASYLNKDGIYKIAFSGGCNQAWTRKALQVFYNYLQASHIYLLGIKRIS